MITEKLAQDVDHLASRGIRAVVSVYPGGHEWNDEVAHVAGDFIDATWGKD
jgi:hypothetical protein